MVRDPHGMLVGVDGPEGPSLQAADWAAAMRWPPAAR